MATTFVRKKVVTLTGSGTVDKLQAPTSGSKVRITGLASVSAPVYLTIGDGTTQADPVAGAEGEDVLIGGPGCWVELPVNSSWAQMEIRAKTATSVAVHLQVL